MKFPGLTCARLGVRKKERKKQNKPRGITLFGGAVRRGSSGKGGRAACQEQGLGEHKPSRVPGQEAPDSAGSSGYCQQQG